MVEPIRSAWNRVVNPIKNIAKVPMHSNLVRPSIAIRVICPRLQTISGSTADSQQNETCQPTPKHEIEQKVPTAVVSGTLFPTCEPSPNRTSNQCSADSNNRSHHEFLHSQL